MVPSWRGPDRSSPDSRSRTSAPTSRRARSRSRWPRPVCVYLCRSGCPRFSTSASGWPLGLLASLKEAAGEIVYVRRGSMLAARLGGKIGHADLDAAAGAGGPHVRDLAPPDEPREVALDVPRDPSGLGRYTIRSASDRSVVSILVAAHSRARA